LVLRVHLAAIFGLRDLVRLIVFDIRARSVVLFFGRGRVV